MILNILIALFLFILIFVLIIISFKLYKSKIYIKELEKSIVNYDNNSHDWFMRYKDILTKNKQLSELILDVISIHPNIQKEIDEFRNKKTARLFDEKFNKIYQSNEEICFTSDEKSFFSNSDKNNVIYSLSQLLSEYKKMPDECKRYLITKYEDLIFFYSKKIAEALELILNSCTNTRRDYYELHSTIKFWETLPKSIQEQIDKEIILQIYEKFEISRIKKEQHEAFQMRIYQNSIWR